MSQRTTMSLKIPILPNGVIMLPGCEFSTSVTSTTFDANDIKGCDNPTIDVKKVLAAIPGSKVIRMSNGTGYQVMSFLELPSQLALDCCAPVIDWYQKLRDLANEPTSEVPDYDDCKVVNYDPYDDSLCTQTPKEHRSDPYVPQGTSQFNAWVP